jgi:hypothetical protein
MTQPVLHWYDFICPFCYIAQDRNRILRDNGVVALPTKTARQRIGRPDR